MRSTSRLATAVFLMLPVLAPPAAFPADSATSPTPMPPAVGKLTVAEVNGLMERKEAIQIFDANERKSYLAGHVPGAQWIAYDAVTVAKLPSSREARVLFYCYNPQCGASPMAAKAAQALGYKNVWLMPEGITGWRAAKLPIVSGAKPN